MNAGTDKQEEEEEEVVVVEERRPAHVHIHRNPDTDPV